MPRVARIVAAGVDTLAMSWQGNLPDPVWTQLEELKADAVRARDSKSPLPVVDLAGRDFVVKPHAGRNPCSAFLLVAVDATCILTVYSKERLNGMPLVRVESVARALWEWGWGAWVDAVREVVQSLAFNPSTGEVGKLVDEMISRIDLCVDIQGLEFSGFDRELRRIKCRAKPAEYVPAEVLADGKKAVAGWLRRYGRPGKSFTGYVFGEGGELKCRIYNKRLELTVSGKGWMEEVWKRSAHYDSDGPVWRIECEVHREVLNRFGVRGFDASALDAIWSYMVGNGAKYERAERKGPWITLRTRTKDKNDRRWPLHPAWRHVQCATFVDRAEPAIRSRARADDVRAMRRGRLGCKVSEMAARLPTAPETFEHFKVEWMRLDEEDLSSESELQALFTKLRERHAERYGHERAADILPPTRKQNGN